MDGEKIEKIVMIRERRRDRGRTNRFWKNEVKTALGERGWTLEQARVTVHDRPVWKRWIDRA